MLITRRGLTSLLALCIPQLRGGARVRRRHLMTAILNTRRVLSRFCLHSHRDEVLGGPRWSITSEGSSCSPVFGPGSGSRALTNCLWMASGEKRPLQAPFVTVCWQMLLGCLSQTHASLPPSAPLHQMACFAFSHGSPWAALSPQLLEAQRHTGSYARSRLWPASILTNVFVFCFFLFFALPPPLWLWTAKAFISFLSRRKNKHERMTEGNSVKTTNAEGVILICRLQAGVSLKHFSFCLIDDTSF